MTKAIFSLVFLSGVLCFSIPTIAEPSRIKDKTTAKKKKTPPAAAEPAAPVLQQFLYTFTNGKQLIVVPGKGVFFQDNSGQKTISNNPFIFHFFENESGKNTNEWKSSLSAPPNAYAAYVRSTTRRSDFVLFEQNSTKPGHRGELEVNFVNQAGDIFTIPLPHKRYNQRLLGSRDEEVSILSTCLNWSLYQFEYAGQTHGLFSIEYSHGASHQGITMLLRGDGKVQILGEFYVDDFSKPEFHLVIGENGNFLLPYQSKEFSLLDLQDINALKVPRRDHQDDTVHMNDQETVAADFVHENFVNLAIDGKQTTSSSFDRLQEGNLSNIRQALNNKTISSAFITSESSMEQSELMTAFIKKVKAKAYPEISPWTEFLQLDAVPLVSGTVAVAAFETKLDALFTYAANNDVIFVINDPITFSGSGSHSKNPNDFYKFVMPYLKKRSIRVLINGNDNDYNTLISHDYNLKNIPRVIKEKIPEEKMDEFMAAWSQNKNYPPLNQDLRLKIITDAQNYSSTGVDIDNALELQSRIYSLLESSQRDAKDANEDDLTHVLVQMGMSPAYFDVFARRQLLQKLSDDLTHQLVGLDSLSDALNDDTLVILSGTNDFSKPQMRRVFAGPKGLGKTFAAQAYAESIGVKYQRFIMADYKGKTPAEFKYDIAKFAFLNPFGVALFDEVEKAPEDIQQVLIAILDSNTIILKESDSGAQSLSVQPSIPVKTSNLKILLATNAGQEQFLKNPNLSPRETLEALQQGGFSEYILDRCREVHVFRPPQTPEEFISVIKAQLLKKISDLQKSKNITIDITNMDAFMQAQADRYFDPRTGYRLAIAHTDDIVSLALARVLLQSGSNSVKSCQLSLQAKPGKYNAGDSRSMGFK